MTFIFEKYFGIGAKGSRDVMKLNKIIVISFRLSDVVN